MIVSAVAVNDSLKIHQVSVEFRTIHTSELDLVAHLHAAAAAHACAIDHNGVKADRGWDTIGLGEVRDSPHHEQRSDRKDVVKMLPRLEQHSQLVGDKTMQAERAIIGGEQQPITHLFKLRL